MVVVVAVGYTGWLYCKSGNVVCVRAFVGWKLEQRTTSVIKSIPALNGSRVVRCSAASSATPPSASGLLRLRAMKGGLVVCMGCCIELVAILMYTHKAHI